MNTDNQAEEKRGGGEKVPNFSNLHIPFSPLLLFVALFIRVHLYPSVVTVSVPANFASR